MTTVTGKPCVKCGSTERYKSGDCAPCARNRSKKNYRENPEKVHAATRKWRKANPERARELARKKYWRNVEAERERGRKKYWDNRERELKRVGRWQKNNPDKVNAAGQRYRQRYPKRASISSRRWQRVNPDKVREYARRRHARLHNADGDHTAEQAQERIDYYGGLCYMCGAPYDEIDHVIALSKGGSNWPANLRPACKPCNASKLNRDWRLFVEAADKPLFDEEE